MATFEEGLSETVRLFRRHGELTRGQLVEFSGLSRSAMNLRIDALAAAGIVDTVAGDVQTRGRPADRLRFRGERGHVLLADMGATKALLGLCDLNGGVRAERVISVDITHTPEQVLAEIASVFTELVGETGVAADTVLGIGMSIPAPVQADAGYSVSPPIMPLWNRFDVPAWFAERYDAPALLEKDANVMAYGEARFAYPDVENLLLVKVGSGIGSGLVWRGELYRGADGAAGDLGHSVVGAMDGEGPLCKCGRRGCLEAYAGGWAILRDLRAIDGPRYADEDLGDLIREGDPRTIEKVRDAGRLIGSAIATTINLINPRVVVVDGGLVDAGGDHLLAGIREMVYRRSLPLATANLVLERGSLYPRSGLLGLSALVVDAVTAPDRIGTLLPPTMI